MDTSSLPESARRPVLFIGHGYPMNVVADNSFTQALAKLGEDLPRPQAILVISAHWLSSGSEVFVAYKPAMIYDFWGFPEGLYHISLGIPSLAHYLPMIYAAALQGQYEPLQFIYEGGQNTAVSMLSFRIG